ncbi:MAG: hypothetical protein ACK501_06230 [Planctomycetota bacterium]|jgi:hypothetical protein
MVLRLSCILLGLFVLAPDLVCAQGQSASGQSAPGQGAAVRKKGALWKGEVDDLVGVLTRAARAANAPAIGGDSVEATAKLLAAMARCHRRYYFPGDVPLVTRSVEFLIKNRRTDGSFGDAAATTWTLDVLQSLPLDGATFAGEIEPARRWLEAKGSKASEPFRDRVRAVLADVRADVFPQHLGAAAANKAKEWIAGGKPVSPVEAADVLVQLVACQVANVSLDETQDPQAAAPAVWTASQQKAFAWLLTQQKDGIFSLKLGETSIADPAMTGFGMLALQTKPKAQRTADEQRIIDAGMRWLLGGQNEDGTFGERQTNYTTCVVVGALARWGGPDVAPALAKAQRAILAFQNCEANDYRPGDRDYGSIGYGSSQRGDLSNLQFSLEALRASGLPADHDAFQKALVFLQRTQNLKATNDFQGKVPHPDKRDVVLDARPGDDGGAAYYPGTSNAGYAIQPDGTAVPRSYGSMTYALLKAYTLCGVPAGDTRVVAAVNWIQQNWTLAVNPGADPALGEKVQYQGLFYYYMVLAQALSAMQLEHVLVTSKNDKGEVATSKVDWKKALRAQLEGMQQQDGTWINGKNDRWMENLPLLCTCYALAALERCQ